MKLTDLITVEDFQRLAGDKGSIKAMEKVILYPSKRADWEPILGWLFKYHTAPGQAAIEAAVLLAIDKILQDKFPEDSKEAS